MQEYSNSIFLDFQEENWKIYEMKGVGKIKPIEETIVYIASKILQLEKERDTDNISLCERGCITREIDYQKSLLDSLTQALNVLNNIYKQCQPTEKRN